MNKGTEIYQQIVDDLVKKSKSCVNANWALNGEAKGNSEHISKLNALFSKLTVEERETLAKYALDAYSSGIYDTLCDLEWYINCNTMNKLDKQRLLTAFVSYGCNVQSVFHLSPKINSFELFN